MVAGLYKSWDWFILWLKPFARDTWVPVTATWRVLAGVADGGNGLQVWRVAGNILNKQSRVSRKGWSCSLGVGRLASISLP
jgi:hypothetical protein